MKCNCIKEIEEKLVGLEFGHKKSKVTKATIPVAILFGTNTLVSITCTEIELIVDGYKKPQHQSLIHSYCPFCGMKTDKGEK